MAAALDLTQVRPAFAEPTRDSQIVFRQVMDAVARPGDIVDLSFAPDAPDGLHRAAGAVALTLFDFETPVWLDPALRAGDAEAWLRFHCGCPLTQATQSAAFAVVSDVANSPPLSAFNAGDAKYPDRSTTVVLQVAALTGGPPAVLSGPGVKGEAVVTPRGLPSGFWSQLIANNARFQFGIDVLLVADGALMALPRSSRIQFEGA